MRSGALLIACVVAACNSGTGVDIDIYAPDGVKVDRVELWVAYDQCGDCPNGVAWNDKERTSGGIFFLRDEALVKAEARPDRFVIHLDAAPGFEEPSWITFVGYEGDKVSAVKALQPEDNTHIPRNEVIVWKMDLHAADLATNDVDTPPPPDRNWRALVWNRAPTNALAQPTGCLVYQKWDGAQWTTDYLVPKTDPDCDGIPENLECNDYWYHYAQAFSTCVADMPLGLAATVCGLGGTACVDGSVNSKLCITDTSSHFACLPDAFCSHCSSQIPADDCIAGAVDQGMSDNTLPYFQCMYAPSSEGLPCALETVSFKVPMMNAVCGSPAMHYLDSPFTAPQNTLVFGSGTDQVHITASSATEPCTVALAWTGGTAAGFGSEGITFLVEVPYSNNTRAFYPVHIDPGNQTVQCDPMTGGYAGLCQAQQASSTDGLFKCAGFNG